MFTLKSCLFNAIQTSYHAPPATEPLLPLYPSDPYTALSQMRWCPDPHRTHLPLYLQSYTLIYYPLSA